MLKKIIAATAAAVLISGCSGEPEAKPSAEDNYISEMRERSTTFGDGDREALLAAGNSVCDYFYEFGANSNSTMTLMNTLSGTFGPKESAVVIAVSVENLCPEFEEPILDSINPGKNA